MLSKEYKLKKKEEFKRIFNKGRYCQSVFIKLKVLENNLQKNHFACAVGLKVSKKATQRNKIKRKIEEIIRLNLGELKQGFDIVIIVDPQIIDKKYNEIEEELIKLLKKAKLLVE